MKLVIGMAILMLAGSVLVLAAPEAAALEPCSTGIVTTNCTTPQGGHCTDAVLGVCVLSQNNN